MNTQQKIMQGYMEWVSDIRRQSSPQMSLSKAIGVASKYMMNTYTKSELIQAIKSDSEIQSSGMEKTWLNALNKSNYYYNNK